MVIPSPRRSDRVPFGTGKAVREISEKPDDLFLTYAPASFVDLQQFLNLVPKMRSWTEDNLKQQLAGLAPCVQGFLETVDFKSKLFEIIKNTSNLKTFRSRFFRWFNAFVMMKYVHYARDHFYPNVPVEAATSWLLKTHFNARPTVDAGAKELLIKLRKLHLKS